MGCCEFLSFVGVRGVLNPLHLQWRGLIPRAKYEEVWGEGGHNKLMLCGDKKHILVSVDPCSHIRRTPAHVLLFSLDLSRSRWRSHQHRTSALQVFKNTCSHFRLSQVGFVQDLDHSKLGDRTGPWSEDRPKEEMLSDYANFDKKCLTMLEVRLDPLRALV